MNLEILHDNDLNLSGKGIIRKAVRALIYDNSRILLIYSPINSDYKLPGGGIEVNETPETALYREIHEECGLNLKNIITKIGLINEYRKPKEDFLDYFKMESTYYLCETIDNFFKEQKLDNYERDLQFKPVWISIEEAIRNNNKLMRSKSDFPQWTKRDTMFLEYIIKNERI
jgi:8-oxo-dGTP pyrophosphatase MutT (NUDIX family)